LKKRKITYIDLAGRTGSKGNNAKDAGLRKLEVAVDELIERTELPKSAAFVDF
jgi:hypothetical protein